MFHYEILDTDPSSGQLLPIPDEFRKGVERASQVLAEELAELDSFDIIARWQFRKQPDGRLVVFLDLTTSFGTGQPGVTGYPYDPDVFVDDARIRNGLSRQIWSFTRVLDYLNKMNLKRLKQDQAALAPA